MEIRLNRAELLTELAPMQGVVERKSTIPVLSHLLLRTKADRLNLAATDLDVSLTSWCQGDLATEGAIAIQARKFLEIARALDGDEVLLALEDESRLRIEAGPSRFRIHGLSSEDFPSLPEVTSGHEIQLAAADLRRMIGKVVFAVSAEESRFQLNGALLRPKKGAVEIVATDGHRLALVETALEGVEEGEGVLIPRKALQELLRFESTDEVLIRRGEHHVSFKVGRRELICRILEGTFPDYERAISQDNDQQALFSRKKLADVVHRVALLTGDRNRAVRLHFEAQGLVVSAANPDLGEATERLDCEYEGPDIELGLNPDYLGQFLSAAETDEVQLAIKDASSQCIGSPVDGVDARYVCVIMPMRL